MRAYIHMFVRDSKQRKQDNEGRHWGQKVTTAEQEDRGLWAADSREEIRGLKRVSQNNGKIWGYTKSHSNCDKERQLKF